MNLSFRCLDVVLRQTVDESLVSVYLRLTLGVVPTLLLLPFLRRILLNDLRDFLLNIKLQSP